MLKRNIIQSYANLLTVSKSWCLWKSLFFMLKNKTGPQGDPEYSSCFSTALLVISLLLLHFIRGKTSFLSLNLLALNLFFLYCGSATLLFSLVGRWQNQDGQQTENLKATMTVVIQVLCIHSKVSSGHYRRITKWL